MSNEQEEKTIIQNIDENIYIDTESENEQEETEEKIRDYFNDQFEDMLDEFRKCYNSNLDNFVSAFKTLTEVEKEDIMKILPDIQIEYEPKEEEQEEETLEIQPLENTDIIEDENDLE